MSREAKRLAFGTLQLQHYGHARLGRCKRAGPSRRGSPLTEAVATPPTASALATYLFNAASERAQRAGRNFGDGADRDLHEIIERGSEWIFQQPEDGRLDLIGQAETDILRLIDMAIENAEGIAGYAPDLLGEQSYFPAKIRFCPCRPFC